jgi:hypothetical protein
MDIPRGRRGRVKKPDGAGRDDRRDRRYPGVSTRQSTRDGRRHLSDESGAVVVSLLARLWRRRHDHPRLVAVAVLLGTLLVAYPFVDCWLRSVGIASPFRFVDFGAYSAAVNRGTAGEQIYVRNEEGGYHGTFLYPPFTLWLFRPFADPFAFHEGAIAWQVVSVVILWVGLDGLASSLGARLAWWERGLGLWALIGFHPLLLSVKLAQTAAFQTAMLCLAFVGLVKGSDGRLTGRLPSRLASLASGALTALVGLFKLPYATAGAHLLSDRDRLAGAVLGGGLLLCLSVSAFGLDAHLRYLDVLAWGAAQGGDTRPPTLWLPPYYRPLSWLPLATGVRVGLVALVAGVAALAIDARREVFALGVAGVPLLAPKTYTYYLVALVPAAVVLVAVELDRADGRPALPVLGVFLAGCHAYGLKLIVDILPSVTPGFAALEPLYPALQPGLWGNLLVFGLALVRVLEGIPVSGWIPSVGAVRSE